MVDCNPHEVTFLPVTGHQNGKYESRGSAKDEKSLASHSSPSIDKHSPTWRMVSTVYTKEGGWYLYMGRDTTVVRFSLLPKRISGCLKTIIAFG